MTPKESEETKIVMIGCLMTHNDVIKLDVLENCGFSLEMREFLKEVFYRY